MKNAGTTSEKQKAGMIQAAGLILAVVVIIGVGMIFSKSGSRKQEKPEVITVSTVEKIIDVSELSTFTAVYNGIAEVPNKDKPEALDYYVSYEAKVNAGIDFDAIEINVDNETKKIHVKLPPVNILDTSVDISSMDFIWLNKKANTSSVSEEAYRACKEDVQAESSKQTAIIDLAQNNAENVLTALIRPIIEQLDENYVLVME